MSVQLLIGYARVSTTGQDLAAQQPGLDSLGVDQERVYVDHGLTGINRARPGLREALAACRAGDTLVVTRLDRLARSVPDARNIVDELATRGVRLNIGGTVHDPTGPVGRLLLTASSRSLSSRPISHELGPVRGWRWPRPRDGSAASNPS